MLLAGGDGARLRSLTQRVAGDSRPKQFCNLLGSGSLLAQTRARIDPLFHRDRQLFVVTRAHEPYYRYDLADTTEALILAQPCNRGTGVAMAFAIINILQCDPAALVAFFPCDHHYSDNEAFESRVRSALVLADKFPSSVVLLGAEAGYPEVEYGWIEPGPAIMNPCARDAFRVRRFWEKPSATQAEDLFRRGCLWNTFVTIGRASTFLDLLCSEVPDTILGLGKAMAGADLEAAYERMPSIDFSRKVLHPQPERLLVLRDGTSGWLDLGSPERLLQALTLSAIRPDWLGEVAIE